jgi:hypothetical protein
MFIKDHQVVFEGCFKNTNEGQMVSRFSNEVGHRFLATRPTQRTDGKLYCYSTL